MAPLSDLIAFEILSRLPAKSVLRFKSVCKQWLALTSDPSFLHAHTRGNPLTISGLLIQDIAKGPLSSFSIDGGASSVLPNPSLSSVDHRFAADVGFLVLQSCNGLLLCRTLRALPSSSQFLLNPTTMQCRQIPNPPTDLYPFKLQFMLAFDPSTSFQYRIACLSCNVWPSLFDPPAPQLYVEIYSSDTGAWELSRETVPGDGLNKKGVYWNGALNWVIENGLVVSFDVEQQLVRITQMPPRERRGSIIYFGESRGHLNLIETVANAGSSGFNWLYFHVFEMGKDNPGWSLLYSVDLRGVRDVYPEATPYSENILRILCGWGFLAAPVFFSRGGEGEDDKLYLCNPENILWCNLAHGTCRKIFAMNTCITFKPSSSCSAIECFPIAHNLFSP